MESNTFDLKTFMENSLKNRYQEDVEKGYLGTFNDWTEENKKKYQKEEAEKQQKELEAKLPKNVISSYHNHHNQLLPIDWDLKTFDRINIESNSKLEKLVNVLKSYTLEDNGFWLSGSVGCGKTHLLLSVFNLISLQYLEAYGEYHLKNIKYYNYSDLCSLLRDDPNNFDKFQKLRSPQYLFIDDVGVSKSSDFIQEKIYSLFNYRVEQNLVTFVTTNLSLKEVQLEFNDRMVSRIKESSAWVDMSGVKDYRSNFIKDNMKKFRFLVD
jgi:DNA replication protein DnaC